MDTSTGKNNTNKLDKAKHSHTSFFEKGFAVVVHNDTFTAVDSYSFTIGNSELRAKEIPSAKVMPCEIHLKVPGTGYESELPVGPYDQMTSSELIQCRDELSLRFCLEDGLLSKQIELQIKSEKIENSKTESKKETPIKKRNTLAKKVGIIIPVLLCAITWLPLSGPVSAGSVSEFGGTFPASSATLADEKRIDEMNYWTQVKLTNPGKAALVNSYVGCRLRYNTLICVHSAAAYSLAMNIEDDVFKSFLKNVMTFEKSK